MKQKQLLRLVTPSWLVSVIGIAIGVVVCAGVVLSLNYQASELRLQVFDVQARNIVDQQQGIYANITLEAEKSSFIGTLPLLITWAAIGLGVYFVAIAVVRGLSRAASLKEELSYINASQQSLKRQIISELLIRLGALIGWFIFIQCTIAVLVPYILASAGAAASGVSVAAVGYIALALLVTYAVALVNAIFLRLVLLRPRVFGD